MNTPPLKEQLRINCVISDRGCRKGLHPGDPGRDGAGGVPRTGARVLAELTGLS